MVRGVESRHSDMASQTAHATLVVDGEERVVAGNDAAAVVFGRDVSDLTGATLSELAAAGVFTEAAVDRYREAAASGAESFRAPMVPSERPSVATYEVTLADGAGDRTVWELTDAGRSRGESETVTALHAATRDLIRADSREEAFEMCADAASRVLGFPATGVRAYDEVTDDLRHVAFGGTVNGADDRPPVSTGDTPHGEAFRTGETVVYAVTADDDLYDDSLFSYTMYVPLGSHGVLSTGTFGDRFATEDVKLAEVLADNTVAALRQLEQRATLQRKNERLSEFASVVAHDLRSPLAVATGSLSEYRRSGTEEFADRATDALERMDDIIDDVLELARSGETVEEPTAVSLSRVAEEAWTSVPTTEASLRFDGPRSVPGDYGRLVRLFENLFRNAVEHGGADEVVVAATDRGFAVCDDGAGFEDDVVESALDAGVSAEQDGNGLGLAIVADIARAHGMVVELGESDAGGACVEFVERTDT